MAENSDNHKEPDLIQVLIEHKIISAAQAELVTADHEVTGMTIVEVLLARRWVKQETLDQVAPWLKDSGTGPAAPAVVTPPVRVEHQTDGYQQNLKKYRRLMHKIVDE